MSTKTISQKDLEPLLFDWKLQLLSCDVAYPVAEFFEKSILKSLLGKNVSRFNNEIDILVKDTLKKIILEIINSAGKLNFDEIVKQYMSSKKPLKVVFVGVNGSGKTTTIAKIAYRLKNKNIISVLACSDTFRAGAEEQLSIHAKRLGLKLIKHQYGADPAAVAYDAVQYATAHNIPVVLIDTAGRMQTDKSLMDELKKIVRVIKADLTLFIGDSLAGNDALSQAEKFNEIIGINGSIITKADADTKGGTAISILFATKKPIIYLGIGQKYDDLIPFDSEWLINKILEL